MKKSKQAPAPAAPSPNAVQFLFVPQTSATNGIGWQCDITGLVGIAVKPRTTELCLQKITGGRVLADNINLAEILVEAKTNNMNTPMAKSRADLKAQWKQAQQNYGARVSAFQAAKQPATIGVDVAAPGSDETVVAEIIQPGTETGTDNQAD